MGYQPDSKILVWPADDYRTGGGTEIDVSNFHFSQAEDQASAEFSFDIPLACDDVYDNYADFLTLLEQIGAMVEFWTTDDGWVTRKCWFIGSIWEVSEDVVEGVNTRSYTCRDRMGRKRTVNVQYRNACRQKVYEFTSASWSWNADDPDFTVDLPDNGEDYVPGGVTYLLAWINSGGAIYNHDYSPDEYQYAAGRKQLMFNVEGGGEGLAGAPATRKSEGWTWVMRILYYDGTDVDATVNQIITDIATGSPWSVQGGLGWDVGDMDLDTIVSFDGVSGKIARLIQIDKTGGPYLHEEDAMRDAGLIPRNYWIRHDSQTDTYKGSYLEQNNGAAYTLTTLIEDYKPYTLEGVAGRVEHHGKISNPINYCLGASITARTDWLTAQGYTAVPSAAGAETNLVDGEAGTFFSWYQVFHGLTWPATPTPPDMCVIDLGEEKDDLDRIQFRHTHPQFEKSGGFKDFGIKIELHRPRITLSGSKYRISDEYTGSITNVVTPGTVFDIDSLGGVAPAPHIEQGDLITILTGAGGAARGSTVVQSIVGLRLTVSPAVSGLANGDDVVIDNPGIPLGEEAMNIVLDPLNVDDSGRDIDAECNWAGPTRYIGLRWEQDYNARHGDELANPRRLTWYGGSEVRALGQESARYPDTHVDAGQAPYAQITDKGTTVTGVVVDPTQFTLDSVSGIDGVWCEAGDHIQLEHLGLYYSGEVTLRAGNTITVAWDSAPPNVSVNDKVGWHKRWMEDFTGTYHDLYAPKQYRKQYNSTMWMEILDDQEVADWQECDMLALERLLELSSIAHDQHCMIGLDHEVYIGRTVRSFSGTDPWMVNSIEIYPGGTSDGASTMPLVVMDIKGTNYDKEIE